MNALRPIPGLAPRAAHPALRLFALAGGFAAGVLAAEAAHPPPSLAIGLGALASGTLLATAGMPRTRATRRAACAFVAAAALGVSLAGLRIASLDRSALAAGGRRAADAILEGQVLSDPVPVAGALRVVLGVHRAEIDARPYRLRERVVLSVRPARSLAAGDRVRVDARLGPLLRPGADTAARAAAARWRRRGIAARAYARRSGVEVTGRATDPLSAVARAGRRAMVRASAAMPERHAGLLLGVTIGDTSRLDPGVEEDFRATGLSHLTAVSGANLAIFLGAIAGALRVARVRRRATVAALAASLLGFMAITRFEPSVLRAGAMAALGVAGLAIGARRETLTALGAACLGLLVWDPFLVHALGFQLSVLATLGIVVLGPRLRTLVSPGRLGTAAAVTLGAQLAVAPLIALHFRQFSLAALPANLLALPAVAPATVLGFAAAALGAAWAPLGSAVGTLARPALAWMSGVAGAFARLPAASVGLPGGVGGVLALAVICALPLAVFRARRPRRGAPVVLALALLATTAAWARALAPPPLEGLVVTALDVGQGDAILVRTPGGATMLVDGGPDERRILAKLRGHGVRRIDLLVLTHPHADHVDGLVAVIGRYPVGRALDAGQEDDLPAFDLYRRALAARRVPRDVARRGARYALGEAVVDVLAPASLFEGTSSDENNSSVVLRVAFGSTCALLSGDVEEEAQAALLEHPAELRCPVLKAPHHGSRKAVPEFFGAAGASIALVSVGRGNDFGHPSPETLAALTRFGARVLRTDLSGDVSIGLGAGGAVTLREERPASRAA